MLFEKLQHCLQALPFLCRKQHKTNKQHGTKKQKKSTLEISRLDAYLDRQWRQWENSCQQLHHWFRCCNHPVTVLRPIAADPKKIRVRGHVEL